MSIIRKITRPSIDPNALYGFVLRRSEVLTLVAEAYDFLLDGYRIIQNSDLAVCKATPSTRYCTRLMQKEALLDGLDNIPEVDLTDWSSVLTSLKRRGKFVTIEDEARGRFLIGPIRRIDRRSATIACFDGAGKWLQAEKITYVDITCVSFDSRYITTHQRYIGKTDMKSRDVRVNRAHSPKGE